MTRKALITGGSGGIGEAIAIRLAQDDIHVWIHYRNNANKAEAIAEQIRSNKGTASTIQFDIRDWQKTNTALERLLTDEEVIDILVHNAGITDDVPFPGMEKSQWDNVIDTSLNGFFHVARPLVMPMIRKRWGRIVSVSSVAALHGNRGQANYAAAKAGLIGASRSLAREVASRGLCVNVVAPGFIQTDMIKSVTDDIIKQTVPMNRVGRPEEVAEVIAFLCSDSASYMTGEVLNVSGGII